MIEPAEATAPASDGYPIHLARWEPSGTLRARLVVVHGVQSHGGWYRNLGRTLAGRGYETTFPDRRGSGRNTIERGHTPSDRRLIDDLTEQVEAARAREPARPVAVAGISWGGKLAVILAARRPDLVDAIALICPGLHPRVDPSRAERLRIAWAFFTNRRKHFAIPLADPALFTDSPEGRAFIAADPLGLRTATASLLAASRFIDRRVKRAQSLVRQPALLMLAGRDRIVDNDRTRDYFRGIGSTSPTLIEYPDGGHTLEFEADPSRYAHDLADWLDAALPAPAAVGTNPAGA